MLAAVEFVTIGEFSKRTGLSVRALRLYDELGLFKPASVDPQSGYRLYAPSQERAALLVRALRAAGVALRDVAAVVEAVTDGHHSSAHELVDSHLDALHASLQAASSLVATAHRLINEEVPNVATKIPTATLAAAVDQVVGSASTDPERPVLMSVLLEGRSTGLRLVASDSYQMAWRELPGVGLLDDGRQVLVPAELLRDLAGALPQEGDVRVEIGDSEVLFEAGDGSFAAPLQEGSFPDYAVGLRGSGDVLIVERTVWSEAVERATADIASPVALALHLQNETTLRAIDAGGRLCPSHLLVGGDWDGPPLVVGLDVAHLDGFRRVPGATLHIEVTDERRPVKVRAAQSPDFLLVVMPVAVPVSSR